MMTQEQSAPVIAPGTMSTTSPYCSVTPCRQIDDWWNEPGSEPYNEATLSRIQSTMGNLWSYYAGGSDIFDKTACLSSGGAAHASAFYTSFRRSAAKVVLQQEASGLASEREEVLLTLENWISEVSMLYDQDEEFPVSVVMQQELVFDPSKTADLTGVSTSNDGENVPATLEENILKGLSSNPLSTPDSIYKIMVQLGKRLSGDEFLRVVGKYPRAARLFASQLLIARSDVTNTFQMGVLVGEYSQAAEVVGKAAYGDNVLDTKRNRLREAAKLFRASLNTASPSITAALSLSSAELHEHCVARSADSFNLVMTSEMLQLMETQRAMERTLAIPAGLLVGSSLVETLQKVITLNPVHRQALVLAIDCAEQYSVPPRQFWWTLLRVLARTDQWETLLALAGAIRPPIGYIPIVEVMLDEDKHDLVEHLLPVIQDEEERQQIISLMSEDQYEEEEETEDQEPHQLDTL